MLPYCTLSTRHYDEIIPETPRKGHEKAATRLQALKERAVLICFFLN